MRRWIGLLALVLMAGALSSCKDPEARKLANRAVNWIQWVRPAGYTGPDYVDAQHYLAMLQAHICELEETLYLQPDSTYSKPVLCKPDHGDPPGPPSVPPPGY